MDNNEQLYLSRTADYSAPSMGADGVWGTAGGIAVRESLTLGSFDGAMDLLDTMDVKAVADTLREAGFDVALDVVAHGRDAIFVSMQKDLRDAAALEVDGFGLADARALAVGKSFAAKDTGVTDRDVMAFSKADFDGDREAAAVIQRLMRSSAVAVELLGEAEPSERGVLLLVAGQAMREGVQGFGFEGIAGKYQVPLSMGEVLELHRDAVRSMAEESARSALGVWVAGDKVREVNDWVPDSVQRLLHGSVSLAAASVVVQAIESGAIGRHAGEIGIHEFTRLLTEQGFDVDAQTVAQQAEELGLEVVEPNRGRGQYVGPVVGMDHRAAIIKFNRDAVVELPFAALAEGQTRPVMGDTVRLGFKAGVLAVSVAQRIGREGVGR